MSAPQLTDWYEPEQKPVRVGVYQRHYHGSDGVQIGFCHWDGSHWAVYGHTIEEAEIWSRQRSSYQQKPWRGLASNPEAK